MRTLDILKLRWRSLVRGGRVEHELDEELQGHIDAHIEELVAGGLPPEAARTAALRAFGGVEHMKESVRDTWRVRPLQDAWQDLRYGVRALAAAPSFTAVALLTIALGVGATTAIFSVVNAVLLRPLPYPGADRVVSVLTRYADSGRVTPRLSGGDLVDIRESASAFEALAFYWGGEIGVRGGGRAELTGVWFVSPDFFRVVGVPALAGRTLIASDVEAGAVVTAGFAVGRFGSERSALGQTLHVDGRAYAVVGVMPAEFQFPRRADVWVAIAPRPENLNRTAYNYPTIARLRPGVSLDQANTQLATVAERLRGALADFGDAKHFAAAPLQERLVGPVRSTLYLLAGAVGLLLLIACANVANLLLARATARSREIALRAALGADRWRIVRQLGVESLLLGGVGGLLGMLLAVGGTDLLVRLAPSSVPRLDEVRVDLPVLAFGLLASLVSSVLFGLAPAWQASRVDLRDRLTQGGTRGSIGGASRMRGAIAVTEIALAVVLAIGAGLLFRSFLALNAVEMGFRMPGLLVMQAHLPTIDLDEQRRAVQRFDRLYPELAALPGVSSVAATVGLPMSDIGSNGLYAVEGKHTFAPGVELPQANFRLTSPGYFRTMGIPVVRGRDFSAADREEGQFVAIISEALARQTFPGEDPIGRRIQCGLDSLEPMTVVGVVGDIRSSPAESPVAELFMPIAQHPSRGSLVQVVLRTDVAPASLAGAVAARVRALDGDVATKFETMESIAAGSLATPRFRTWLVGVFAAIALALAVAGIYGLMAYLTAQRAPELGIRLALGAGPASVLGMVLGAAARLAGIGIVIGLAASIASGRAMSAMLFGLGRVDVVTYVVVSVAVLAVSAAAALVPAWRASRFDPLTVIRSAG